MDAAFPEITGKILYMTGDGGEGKKTNSPNYSHFLHPAKATDDASYPQILIVGSVGQEAGENQPLTLLLLLLWEGDYTLVLSFPAIFFPLFCKCQAAHCHTLSYTNLNATTEC